MATITATGFNYVSEAGMEEYWNLLECHGIIGLLFEFDATAKTNALMQSESFSLDTYIKTNYPDCLYSEMSIKLIDEMMVVIAALDFAFVTRTFDIVMRDGSIHIEE